ncbi:hypothetical protein SDC9_125088 [bioreactor metagenome]|uniref:RNA-binding S4 domain-containing protein n=1 Tax=bioreactor metagenome TaxID=1076179 RepID=A0A645CME1_9ZZZZ
MRLDKYLKVSRLIKRRTVANQACDMGRVQINGKAAKPSQDVKEGDVLTLEMGPRTIRAKVVSLNEHAQKADADAMYVLLPEGQG